ncbi:MAG TPA: arylsulfotransferase family protein [Streptosporangiaceae bacterium]|nr:arylsulfotransferase family protein [Streptosporangiaceae bacterium]
MGASWTRRQVLRRGGAAAAGVAGLGLAGFIGYSWPHAAPTGDAPSAPDHPAAAGSGDVGSFVTRSDLRPPVVTVTQSASGASQPPYIFIAPRGYTASSVGQSGLMIVDRDGSLVWFGPPLGGTPLNFTTQQYRGKPVLTWSAGSVNDIGVTTGTSYIADSSYRVIATVKAGNGAQTDLHEFNLTPQGTALITAHRKVPADLSALSGPAKGTVLTSIAQEIDVATGAVLFEWDSIAHVPLTESYQPLAGGTASAPYDYFHINSIALAPDGDLLISSRNTWTIYKVARPGGAIRWRLGGKKSDFSVGPGAAFSWQHDARMPRPGLLTLFDNASAPPEEKQSRALLLDVDAAAMRVTLRHAYTHPAGLLADNQGSVQLLPDGRVFVGWGAQPYFSEFAAGGELLLDGEFPVNDQSYRAFTFGWAGNPPGSPAAVVRPNPARGSAVHVSWNGATEVETWAVLAGRNPSALTAAGSQRRAGFETMISVNSEGPYFAVTAHDASGRQLGRSATVRRTTA